LFFFKYVICSSEKKCYLFDDSAFGGYPSPVVELNSCGILFLLNAASNRSKFLLGKGNLSSGITKKGEYKSYINKQHEQSINLCIIKDNKQLNFYTNFAKCSGEATSTPEVLQLYRENMRGVDWADLILHIYFPKFRSYKWKHCLFFDYFFMSLNNVATYFDSLFDKKIGR